jgi:hypothetical protein
VSDDIWVSQKVEHRASGAYFEKDSDGDIILCGYYLNKQCIESFKGISRCLLTLLANATKLSQSNQNERSTS